MLRAIVAGGLVMLLLLLGLGGCGDNSTGGNTDAFNRIQLDPVQFPTLKSGLVYEGWLVNVDQDSNWVSYQGFGKFFWDERDFRFLDPADTTKDIGNTFTISQGSVFDYGMIAITLEPYPTDPDPKPSPTVIALSSIVPDRATVLRFPRAFGSGQGWFSVGTFSDGRYSAMGQTKENERHGLWFTNLIVSITGGVVTEAFAPGITLPTLPDTGYLYEGWVALNNGDTVSTGKFFSPAYIDYDNSHCAAGAVPNFPGEDFINNKPANVPDSRWPIDILSGGTVLVTLEPNPDNDLFRPSPFVILKGNLPVTEDKVRNGAYEMGFVTAYSFPKINASFLRAK